MTMYAVRVPFAGWIDVDVEAETVDEAVELAFDQFPELSIAGDEKTFPEWSYEAHRRIVEGNVCYAEQTEVSVYDIDADTDTGYQPKRGWS